MSYAVKQKNVGKYKIQIDAQGFELYVNEYILSDKYYMKIAPQDDYDYNSGHPSPADYQKSILNLYKRFSSEVVIKKYIKNGTLVKME